MYSVNRLLYIVSFVYYVCFIVHVVIEGLMEDWPCQMSHPLLTLRERLRTHKVFTKKQSFYLNYHKFSIKSYVLDVY